MNNDNTVRGYRILGEKKPEKELSYEYLKLSHEATLAQDALRAAVKKKGAKCLNRQEEFSGRVLMTDLEAQRACAGCPSFEECDIFRMLSHPGWGTLAGKVHGHGVMETLDEEES